MQSPSEENPIINSDIENDVTSDTRNLVETEPVEETTGWIKCRTVLGIMGFLGFAVVYAMRVNLSVAIVAMVNTTKAPPSNDSTLDVCPTSVPNNSTPEFKPGDFNWTIEQQSIVLGSFFYGYVLTQIPGGRIAELYGGKFVYGIGILLTAVFTLLSPIAAYTNFSFFIAVRALAGLSEGVTYPAMHAMLAKWIPPLERSKFAAYVYAGSNIGTVVTLPISGWLCTLDFAGGWPLCFYIFGGLGVVWFVGWIFLIYDSPHKHPRICPKEIEYITYTIGPQEEDDKPALSIPWCKFLTCVPLWAILIAQCGQAWVFYTQFTELPSYMNNILHFDIVSNATLSAVPYLTAWIGGILLCIVADWILAKGWISRLNSMKLWNTVSAFVPAFGLLGIAWAGCDRVMVMTLLSLASAFGGAAYAGNQMNHIDLSPQFAGTMYGITNAASNICGFMAPYVVSLIINAQQQTLGQWREVFYLAAAIDLGTNLFYLFFASTEEQDWSRPDDEDMTASAPVESILFPES
ncbi:hypothetical protein K1T71_007906 [Dendrolimus kikuchii]|uniref:Uncharacterized protein n=1 Tax=Dendrolimus kikuchii TaxID=765133 RepID=A0ACC1CZK9_9NEOP|nr:hypothetical protein K1T71_007906 [Dendrolimus kikuchii]